MKIRFNQFLIILFFFFLSQNMSHGENITISFVDMDKIISQSNVGKKIQKTFNQKINKENKKFNKIEVDLKKLEQELLKKKNILSKEELDKEIKSFQTSLSKFRQDKIKSNREINKQNLETTNKMVNEINKILTKYAVDNSISLILQKKHIIIGKSNLDITDNIMKMFNDKIKSID